MTIIKRGNTMLDKSQYTIYTSPYGKIKICYNDNAITYLKRIEEKEECNEDTSSPLGDMVKKQLDEYFSGKRKKFDIPTKIHGTDFQKKVWKALCDIPYGETRTYKEIAIAIGNDKACRAVGLTNNRNPITILIPCHRVIGSNGKLVGYAGGLDMKIGLLELESANK
jgi:O-6-methylguanine DNA methyltransferase